VQYPPQVAVYRKGASGDEKPKRLLIGDKTRLSDSHGMAIDTKNKLLFVNNWGNISDYRVPGSGRFEPPSITVYPLNADGDTAPLSGIHQFIEMNDTAGCHRHQRDGHLRVIHTGAGQDRTDRDLSIRHIQMQLVAAPVLLAALTGPLYGGLSLTVRLCSPVAPLRKILQLAL
jgi:hypothetical protein